LSNHSSISLIKSFIGGIYLSHIEYVFYARLVSLTNRTLVSMKYYTTRHYNVQILWVTFCSKGDAFR